MSNDQITLVAQALDEFQGKLESLEQKLKAFEQGTQELKNELRQCRESIR